MVERAHLSIGEVLNLLQEDFPDITISKIRFLESQGLLDPERTPSGYRKFYQPDIERLRWILRQQRENFLPLKVIRRRLDEVDPGAVPSARASAPAPVMEAEVQVPADPEPAGADEDHPLASGPSSVSLTLEELASSCGLSPDEVAELEKFGLVVGKPVGPSVLYDGDALAIAQLAAGFLRHGVEPRHLKMYRLSGDREAGLIEQIVNPLLKQRSAGARGRARDMAGDLVRLGDGLRAALLRQSLRLYLGGD